MTERRKKASAMHCAASSGRCRSPPPPVTQWMTEHDSNTPASNSCFSAAGLKSRNLRSNLFFFFLPFFLSAPLTSSSSACSLVCLCHHLFISGVRDLDSAPLGWLVVSRRQGARQLCVTRQRACLCVRVCAAADNTRCQPPACGPARATVQRIPGCRSWPLPRPFTLSFFPRRVRRRVTTMTWRSSLGGDDNDDACFCSKTVVGRKARSVE